MKTKASTAATLLIDTIFDILSVTGDAIKITPDVVSDMVKTLVRDITLVRDTLEIDGRMISVIALVNTLTTLKPIVA